MINNQCRDDEPTGDDQTGGEPADEKFDGTGGDVDNSSERDGKFDGAHEDDAQDDEDPRLRRRRRRRAAWSTAKVGAQIMAGQFVGWCLHRWLG